MLIVGVNGSPRLNGLTIQLVDRALLGAHRAGADVQRLDLIEFDIKPWPHSARQSFDDLDRLLTDADGLVLGSPVYYKDVSGLMREFIDYLHHVRAVGNRPGRPGFGISVAGGSGMGQIDALGSLYGYFFFRGYRPLDPIPVSRFSFPKALDESEVMGVALAQATGEAIPFADTAEKLAHYASLRYLDFDGVDEFMLLVGQILDSEPVDTEALRDQQKRYREAQRRLSEGSRDEAIELAAPIYDALFRRGAI